MFLTWIKTKLKMKRVVAGALACALSVTAVISGLEPGTMMEANAYSREYGICIDSHTATSNASNCIDDQYSNKLAEIWNLDPNSDAYKQGLQYNLNWLHAHVGNEEMITRVFFGGLFTYIHELGKGGTDAASVQAMYDYVIRSMWDSAMSGTFPELNAGGDAAKQAAITNTILLNELELGQLLHGGAGQQVLARHRLLQIISEDPKNVFDPTDWHHVPQILPRLSKAWLQSYGTYQSGQTGMALWPADSQTHTVQSNGRDPILKEGVQAAALDMTKDSAYFTIGGKSSSDSSGGTTTTGGKSSGSDDGDSTEDDTEISADDDADDLDDADDAGDSDDADDDDSDDSDDDKGKKNSSGSQEDESRRTDYYMNLTKEMFENAVLMIWNDATQSWFTYSPILYNANRALHGGTGEVINGWNIQTVWEGDKYYIQFHDTTNGASPQPLYMYFNIQQGAVVSSSEAVFDSVEAFCATYMKISTCDKCPRGRRELQQHQRFISFWPYQYNSQLPCFSLGGVGSTWTYFPLDQQAGLHFCIYSHNEDWTTDYNVQLKKYDAEIGKPLEDAEFKLYERFDDKDEINPDSDGAVELYEGDGNASGDSGKDDSGSSSKEDSDDDDSGSSGTHAGKWQGGYTSSPVVWDDFREVFDGTTDSDGHIHFDSTKSYHYEKTFCDGHPFPKFIDTSALEEALEEAQSESSEGEGEDGGDGGGENDAAEIEAELEEAKEKNMEAAAQWLSYVDACKDMAENERPGVHFHWMLDEGMESTVQEVADSGEYGGEAGKGTAGSDCPTGVDTAYENSGAKEDCQDTYNKFIALKYSYTWKEIRARSGYTIHVKDDEEEGHTDDVPIEIITTDSSQNGANSTFGSGYSKDITINENAARDSGSGNETSGKDEDENTKEAKASRLSFTTKVNPLAFFGLGITAHAAENAESAEAEEEEEKKSGFDAFFGKVIRAISFFTESDDTENEEAEEADEEDIDEDAEDSGISIENTGEDADDTDDEEIAADDKEKITADVSSITDGGAEVASGSDLPENKKAARKTGIAKLLPGLFRAARVIADDEADDEDEDSGDAEVSGGEDYMAIWEKAFEDPQVGGEDVEIGPDDNWSHCNDKDGEGNMWRVYDHRTEGEIHFNKRDFDLSDNRDKMDDYAAGNGDGTLEGAVYGLFARNDIVHPDGKTGVVYKKDDLVAVATTDRNGDGSFMAFTEAPGTRYDYKTGKLYHTDWYNQAPKNLYQPKGHTAELQPNVTFNKGVLRNTQWYSDDYTEDGTYKNGALTQRVYDDNETNNGNCWIGRPLIVNPNGTTYYIKELSRSEGYELSVNGKDRFITNYGASLDTADTGDEETKGQVDITANLYLQEQESIGLDNEPFFDVTSKDTNENGGYDIVVNKLPEGTKFYRQDTTDKDYEDTVTTGYTTRYKGDTNQNGKIDEGETWVQKKADTDGIPKYDPETNQPVTHKEEAKVTLPKLPIAENTKAFDGNAITGALNADAPSGDILTKPFTETKGDTENYRFVKWKNVVADCYAIGDPVYTIDAETGKVVPEYETETVPVTGNVKFTKVERAWTNVPAKYENGKYIIHVDVPYTDCYGVSHTDMDAWLDQEYKAVVPEGKHTLTDADIKDMGAYRANEYGVKTGDQMSSGSYEVYAKHAYAEVYKDYESAAKTEDSTYIKEITLNYPGQDYWMEDGGTVETPVQVLDRPIRQKIKVTKDIATPRSVNISRLKR